MQWDAHGNVRPSPPPVTNAERQREFRRRNPDYYRLLKARQRAAIKARVAEMRRLERERATVVRREPLMLPAPVERIEIPGMNVIPAMDEIETMREIDALRARLCERAREAVPVTMPARVREVAAMPSRFAKPQAA